MSAKAQQIAGLTCKTAVAALLLAAAAASAAATTSAAGAGAAKKTPTKKVAVTEAPAARLNPGTLSSFNSPVLDTGRFKFTAPGGSVSPRLAAQERAFSFTPSGQLGNRKALTLGVTSRVLTAAADTSKAAPPADAIAAAPRGYGVDVAVGWRGFAVSGGYSRADSAMSLVPERREAFDVGLSYRFNGRWKTSLQLAAESGAIPYAPLDRAYSAELGAAYAVTPRLSLSGGVKYQILPAGPGLDEAANGDSSVYFGTAFAF